jgi:hypothetical protein
LAIAARVTKYGISVVEAIWRTPLAVINQLLIFDDIQSGRRFQWKAEEQESAMTIEQCIAEALTPPE